MTHLPEQDWDPKSDAVQRDQRAAYDDMRERCPVAYSETLGWSLFRHEDIVRVLNDPDAFSNAVSRHLSVPDGMDPPEHTAYRRMIEPYFRHESIAPLEPRIRAIAADLAGALAGRGEVEFIGAFAQSFAVRVQCSFLGWPDDMREALRLWTQKNHAATFARDQAAMAGIAREFEGHVARMLQVRRTAGAAAGDDVTARLMREQVLGRPLGDQEIVSVLRNWTVGEVATIAAAVGIVAGFIAQFAGLQGWLRAQPSSLPDAIEEILRLHGPLAANRRVTTRAVEIGGRKIGAGERISLNWIAANRDGRAFEHPQAFVPERDQRANLLYGAGIHLCPGAPLARMELRVAIEELLAKCAGIELIAERPATGATYPAGGFATLPLRIR